jgi:hypothetical protein
VMEHLLFFRRPDHPGSGYRLRPPQGGNTPRSGKVARPEPGLRIWGGISQTPR